MIKIEKTEVFGWEAAIRGMRNPMNSWDKSDSLFHLMVDDDNVEDFIGKNDIALMKRLSKAGSDHSKYMRMINVSCDITAPLYWWKEYDTYKVGTVANSCSTMHKIHAKDFEWEDFSTEHLLVDSRGHMVCVIDLLNWYRQKFIETNDKCYWWQMIQLLPSSYNQKRTVQLNYEVLKKIYFARKNHKLDEWRTLCDWIRELPYSEIITLEGE